MKQQVNFKVSKEDRVLIEKIVTRYQTIVRRGGKMPLIDHVDREMDIAACHANGTPLLLAELLAAKEFDFMHDIIGIQRHINRETGKLNDHFLPRCAAL